LAQLKKRELRGETEDAIKGKAISTGSLWVVFVPFVRVASDI